MIVKALVPRLCKGFGELQRTLREVASTGQPLIVMSCNPMGETMMVACMARSLPRVERVLYKALPTYAFD